ncbi:sulfurtransferase [Qipengyuania sediminis]|uniref:sulfurtransferase n=1 Tax=Qipengyuania sediminis TaxID=1532023 RepID=UPI00105A9A34|nr:sulfurtransferase [Qipengyuania sediminis]
MHSLVSTDWLGEHMQEPGLRILDASLHLPAAGRDAAAEFAIGHIPGASFLDLAALRDPSSALPNTLPTPAQAAARFAALGLARGDRIVLYDDSALLSAARGWFVLRGFGFGHIALLDGGLGKWRAEGRPLESGITSIAATDFAPTEFTGATRDKADMLANISSAAEQVVDARDSERFAGTGADMVHGLPGGHIPGARNLHYRDLLRPDGTFRPATELRAAFAAAGIDPARPIAASCGSGVTASAVLFALHLLGLEGALYDGSWSEWGADPATPKATGPA